MSSRQARHDPKRGRHKKRRSLETRRWESEHLVPARPPWMPPTVYTQLRALRDGPPVAS